MSRPRSKPIALIHAYLLLSFCPVTHHLPQLVLRTHLHLSATLCSMLTSKVFSKNSVIKSAILLLDGSSTTTGALFSTSFGLVDERIIFTATSDGDFFGELFSFC